MWSLPGSLADVVLADAILIPPSPNNIRKVRDRKNGTETRDACQHLMLHPYINCLKNKQLKLKCLQW